MKPDSTITGTRTSPNGNGNGFGVHIRAARQVGKPLVIHNRDATQDVLRLMAAAGEVGGVSLLLHRIVGGGRASA